MLRAMIGFDHCLKNVANTWFATSGYAVYQVSNNSGKGIIIDSNGAMSTTAGNPGSNMPQWNLDLTPFLVSGITSLTIGMRVGHTTAGNSGIFMYIATEPAAANYIQVLTFAQLGITAAGSSVYVEFAFDLVANTLTTYLDGVSIGSAALSGTFLANLKLGKCTLIANPTGQNVAGVTYVRDIYATDNIAGDGMVGRLGPQTIYPISVDAAAGNGWSSSDGSTDLVGTLNAAQPSAVTLNSPVDKTPLVTSLKTFAPVGFNIKAVQLGLSALSRGDSSSTSKVEIAQGGTTLSGVNVIVPKAGVYAAPVKLMPLAPDGGAWSLAKVDNTQVTITPDV